jgi:protein SCO1/2
LLAGHNGKARAHSYDISGNSPPLAFAMTRASDGKEVTQATYHGKVVMLYFGYTNCPDVCPLTMTRVAEILKRLGPEAAHVRVLFVTVDPIRDTLPVLARYVKAFAPQVEGLRGTPDQLAALARRYRVVYSATQPEKYDPYEKVTHSAAVYVFDASGDARLLISSLATGKPDIAGATAHVRSAIEEKYDPGLLTRLWRLL